MVGGRPGSWDSVLLHKTVGFRGQTESGKRRCRDVKPPRQRPALSRLQCSRPVARDSPPIAHTISRNRPGRWSRDSDAKNDAKAPRGGLLERGSTGGSDRSLTPDALNDRGDPDTDHRIVGNDQRECRTDSPTPNCLAAVRCSRGRSDRAWKRQNRQPPLALLLGSGNRVPLSRPAGPVLACG